MYRTSWFVLLVLAGSGCSKIDRPDLPERFPVSGTVMYRGKPASGFRVAFHPRFDIGELKFAPSAVTKEDGTFELRSYDPNDGAPAGEYAVVFRWPDRLAQSDDIDAPPEVDQLRGAYNDPEKSKFIVTIQAAENQLPPFEIR